jgi:geranylgeranyl diphosphate synthase, type II
MRHAVFPAGKRLRPRLLLTVAKTCAASEGEWELAIAAACAIELVHSASLVHDDLPCFDDAGTRRGMPTVHKLFGEPLAVLAGDALLALAFECLARSSTRFALRIVKLVRLFGKAVGSRQGIIGGQSMEQDEAGGVDVRTDAPSSASVLGRYHDMKTASLFRLAAEAGATAAGAANSEAWGEVGQSLGLAYQLADDLFDACGNPGTADKPVGRDAALGRPNAALLLGENTAAVHITTLIEKALERTSALARNPQPLVHLIEELGTLFTRTGS